MPEQDVDHSNKKTSDNVWSNLRRVTKSENMRNKKKYKNNKSGVPGVYFAVRVGKWGAEINSSADRLHFGWFEDWFEAVCARKSAQYNCGYHPNHGCAA